MQTLFLYPCRYQNAVVPLAEIYRPGVVAMLIWHQGRVLPEVGFLSQVLDHGDGRVVEGHGSLAGGRFQLAHFHIPADKTSLDDSDVVERGDVSRSSATAWAKMDLIVLPLLAMMCFLSSMVHMSSL